MEEQNQSETGNQFNTGIVTQDSKLHITTFN